MGLFRTVAIIILSISFVVFVALFGRLPAFRRTPIGFLHRVIWKYIPNTLFAIDDKLTGGRVSHSFTRVGNYLMNEPHPLVLIFFLALQIIGESLFVPAAWSRLSAMHHILIPIIVAGPYTTLYLSHKTSSNITEFNHRSAMLAYPYDFALFHPGYFCSTCRRPKPPRSKHCPICKACIERQDHHCIWINNCVGRNNYIWFILLLLTTTIMLAYATAVGYSLLDAVLQERFVPIALTRGSFTAKRWSTSMSWGQFLDSWVWAITYEWRIGITTSLAAMTCPLGGGFLAFHVYLIWTGMTTNESGKWSDWKEDIADDLVYRAEIYRLREEYPPLPEDVEPRDDDINWPARARARWWVLLTKNGERPTKKVRKPNDNGGFDDLQEIDERWIRIRNMAEVHNVYDLGFWENLKWAMFDRNEVATVKPLL